jgi:hypothetical protein
VWISKPENIGKVGEKHVARKLNWLSSEYTTINDVLFPTKYGTTQIDHIVVSPYGIFIIETKNYKGWIFGNAESKVWTQSLYAGRRGWHKRAEKHTFQNPIRQNYRHICALADNLGIDKSYFHGVIAFVDGCEFKTEMPEGVVCSRRVAEYICGFKTPIIKPVQVPEVASAIEEWQGTLSEKQIDSHVANLNKRHLAVGEGAAPRCPYCGAEMTLRKRRSDGKSFYGCRSYPKCRGIVNVE